MSIYDRFEKHADKTFRDARERYIREFTGRHPRRQVLALEGPGYFIDDHRLIDVDDEALQPFKTHRLAGTGPFDRPAMAGTVNKELTAVSTVMHAACGLWRWIPGTPKIRSVEGDERRGYPLSWEEQDRLFRCLPNGWTVGAALFAINTGVRKAELFGLKWADEVPIPELDTFVFVLRETKNGEQRAVICNSIARRVVGHQRGNGSEYVFPAERCNQSSKAWITAWKKAGMPDDPLIRKGIHNCRHTFAYRLRTAGVSEENRNALLGHARVSLAQHYALPDIEVLSVDAEKAAERRTSFVLR